MREFGNEADKRQRYDAYGMHGTKCVPTSIAERAAPSDSGPSRCRLPANWASLPTTGAHVQNLLIPAVPPNELSVRPNKDVPRTTVVGFNNPAARSHLTSGQQASRGTGTGTTTGSVQNFRGGGSQNPSKEAPERVPPVRASPLKEELRPGQPPRQRRCQISIVFHSRDNGSHLWSLFLDCGNDSNILSYIVGPAEQRRYGERRNIRLNMDNLRAKLPVADIQPEQASIYRHLLKSSYATAYTDWWLDSRRWCLDALTSLNTARVIDVEMEDIEARGDSPFEFGT